MEPERYERLKPIAKIMQRLKARYAWTSAKSYGHLKKLNESYGFTGVTNWCILPDVEVQFGPSLLSTLPIPRTIRLETGAFLNASSEDEQLTANDIRDIQQYDGKIFMERQYKRRARNSLVPWHYYIKMRWPSWEDIPATAYSPLDSNDMEQKRMDGEGW